jgi:hypothetical protein
MTAKEKAKDLIYKYGNIKDEFNNELTLGQAKKSAIISIDEILDSHGCQSDFNYWLDVKQEIENFYF